MKTNIVLFWFMNDWGKFGRAYEKIAENLAVRPEVGRVVCVLPPKEVPSGEYSWPLGISKLSPKLLVLRQATRLVPTGSAPFRLRVWVNNVIPGIAFRLLLKLFGFTERNTLLWLYPPHQHIEKLRSLVPHFKTIIQVVDNNSFMESSEEGCRNFAKTQYESLIAEADEVIVSSDSNYRIFSELNPRCHKFENAVDRIFLAQPSGLPSLIDRVRPRLGYVGWITERTDVDLLLHLAKVRPEYDLILAGPVGESVDISEITSLPNASWCGPLPYSDVPNFLASLDVCLIPHRDTPYSRSMSPLKLFQYLGSGRPIVSTRVAGIERWKEHVRIGDSYDEFVEGVDASIEHETLDRSKARIHAAAQETWDQRVAEIVAAVL